MSHFIVLESPYSGQNRLNNIKYALLALKQETQRGHCVFASHLLTTQTVFEDGRVAYIDDDEHDPHGVGRDMAIKLSNLARDKADYVVFYIDLGWSSGMKYALEYCEKNNIPHVFRHLNNFDEYFKQ